MVRISIHNDRQDSLKQVVLYTENDKEIRAISARKPTRTQRLVYEEGVDFTKGIRGKHVGISLKVLGKAETVWAVCLTKEKKELILFKLYNIEVYSESDEVKVKNEKGKVEYYPKSLFAQVAVPKKILGILEKAI